MKIRMGAPAACLGDGVLPLVQKVQDVFRRLRINNNNKVEILPHIVVAGSEGSGKSSVLEALVGRDFLPRASTFRPLIIQLRQIRDADDSRREYAEFSHIPGTKFYDFNQIRTQIQAETDREAGGVISDKEIQLKIFSPNFLDITLVDLPGIPKGPHSSDSVTEMVMSYLKNPNTLILAVVPANTDISNSDALRIAGNVDPDGYRTIGVLTKLDTMSRMYAAKAIPLRLGYVGVVNRSQEDIMLNRTIKDAIAAEEAFFRSHPAYDKIAGRCGVPQLATQVNLILVHHLNIVLQGFKSFFSSTPGSLAKELAGIAI